MTDTTPAAQHTPSHVPGQLRLDGLGDEPVDTPDRPASDDLGEWPVGGARRSWSSPFGSGWTGLGVVVVIVVLVGTVARLTGLDDRPFHHDESLDAWFSWRYLEGSYEGYDPVYHGPLRFYITAWFFVLFGESETIARLLAALAGAAVVALPWFWRRDLGDVGTVAAAVLLAVSPSMLYFSRFGREDSFFLALTFASVIVLVSFLRTPRVWHPMALLCLVVAAMAVKESVFISIFVFGGFGMVLLTQELLLSSNRRPVVVDAADARLIADEVTDDVADDDGLAWDPDAVRRVTLLAGLAALIVALFFGEPIFVSLGAYGLFLAAPMVAAGVAAWRRGADLRDVGVIRSVVSVPLAWWAAAVGAATFTFVALFSQFFTRFEGAGSAEAPHGALMNGLRAGFEYWRGEQDTVRGDARWQYYLAVVPGYEWFVLALAAVGIVSVLRRPGLLGQTLVWWGVASLSVHSWAGERMPWLIIHPLLPFVLLAGLGVQTMWERRTHRAAAPVAALVGLGLVFTVVTSYQAAYVRGGEPKELLVQAGQATPEVTDWVDRLEHLDRLVFAEEGRHLLVSIDSEVYWPYGWYLRDFPTGTYAVLDEGGELPTTDVVFLPHWKLEAIGSQLVGYTELPYEHRWWWVPEYDVGPRDWLRWAWDRTVWDGSSQDPSDLPGTLVGSVYVRDEILALEQRYASAGLALGG